ncbi:MAG: hypothetical protein Q7S52_00915 [bacterium]|nr:hypothetical protein [bacterium]
MKEINFGPHTFEEAVENAQRVEPDEHSFGAPLVRTFKADVADLLTQEKTTKLDIIMAEKARRTEREKVTLEEERPGSHLGKTIFILGLLFAFGIGIGAYTLIGATIPIPFLSKKAPAGEAIPAAQEEGGIIITGSPREQLLVDIAAAFRETTGVGGNIRVVKFMTSDASGKIHTEATTGELLSALGVSAPPQDLLRSLDKQPAFGIYGVENLSGFLQLRSRSYPETFASMLLWEPKMAEDLILALRPDVKRSDVTLLRGREFKDERIAGVNARVLSDPGGTSLLAHAFLDQQTLVIAGGRETLRALIEKFQTETKK